MPIEGSNQSDSNVEKKESTNLSPEEQKNIDKIVSGNPDDVNGYVQNNESLTKAKNIMSEELPDHDPVTLTIEKRQMDSPNPIITKEIFSEKYEYTTPLLTIRNMNSFESEIPSEAATTIKDAINKLGDFQTIKVIGCTDASPINTPDAIQKNKNQFDEIRSTYIQTGGICPTYQELLKSPEDPQNVILGYTRAMEGVLSLHLTPDQMKKLEIGNKLGTNPNDANQRGFDVETNYTGELERTISGVTYENIYRMFGELSKNQIGRNYNNTTNKNFYTISGLQMSTSGDFDKIYQDIFTGVKNIVGEDNPQLEEKAKQQTTDYLNHLIHVCGGEFLNGTWSSEDISDKMYFLIMATDPEKGFLSQDEFMELTKNGNLSILEKKSLDDGQNIQQFISTNNITGVYKGGANMYFYNTTTNTGNRTGRKISSKEDYIKLALYFEMTNTNK